MIDLSGIIRYIKMINNSLEIVRKFFFVYFVVLLIFVFEWFFDVEWCYWRRLEGLKWEEYSL